MSKGFLQRLPITFTGDVSTLPVVDPDPVLNAGSLMLVDLTNPEGPLDAGIPSTSIRIPNLAAELANAVVGAGEVRPLLDYAGITAPAFIERTTKGALHVSLPLSHSGKYARLNCPTLLAAWMHDNPTHDYYFSIWERITRVSAAASEAMNCLCFASSPGPTDILVGLGAKNANYPSTSGNILGSKKSPNVDLSTVAAGTAVYNEIAVNQNTGTVGLTAAAAMAANQVRLWSVGHAGAFGPGTTNGRCAALMRLYIEDLTVSGRSYAAVEALDYANFTRLVSTSGGRYYGDTYTAPVNV